MSLASVFYLKLYGYHESVIIICLTWFTEYITIGELPSILWFDFIAIKKENNGSLSIRNADTNSWSWLEMMWQPSCNIFAVHQGGMANRLGITDQEYTNKITFVIGENETFTSVTIAKGQRLKAC